MSRRIPRLLGILGGVLIACAKRPIDTGAIAFGQGVSVSALQLITAASAIANLCSLAPCDTRFTAESSFQICEQNAHSATQRAKNAGPAQPWSIAS